MNTNQIPAREQMYKNITGYWVTQLMGAAARLGVADLLEPGALDARELATRVGADPQALYRALRACAAVGVFTEEPGQVFANNALSRTLRANVPGSMRDLAIAQSAAGHWRPWGLLTEAVKTGRSTSTEALGFCCSRKNPFWFGSARWTRAFCTAASEVIERVSSPSRPRWKVSRSWNWVWPKRAVSMSS